VVLAEAAVRAAAELVGVNVDDDPRRAAAAELAERAAHIRAQALEPRR
jgi:hypothetical protein